MAVDKYESLGPLMNELGGEIAAITDGDIDGLYLYAEIEEGSPCAGVFQDEGDLVRYYDPTDRLFDLLLEAWTIEDPDPRRRWTAMEYSVREGRFKTEFIYREELTEDETITDRRRRALKKRYGDKPVIYPPMD